jgi:hypothetical protein
MAEKQKMYNKHWKDTNKERIREYNRKRYEEKKEGMLEQMAIWRSQNAEKIKNYNKQKRQENFILYVPLKEPEPEKFIYKIILRDGSILNFKKKC